MRAIRYSTVDPIEAERDWAWYDKGNGLDFLKGFSARAVRPLKTDDHKVMAVYISVFKEK